MERKNALSVAFYSAFALQSAAQAIIWQFVTYFLKHDIRVDSFLLLTFAWVAPAIMTMLAVNFWGWFSDGMKKRKVFMLVGFIGYAGTFFLTSFVRTYTEYIMVTFFGAFFSAAALPVGQAYLTTDTEKKGERLGYFLAAQSFGWFFGAFGSGFLYDIVGMYTLYQVSAIIGIGAFAICLVFIRDAIPKETQAGPKVGYRELFRKPGLGRLTVAAGFSSLGINSISFLLAILIVDELHGAPSYVGLANSAATIIAVVITGYIGKVIDRRGPVRILIVAYFSYVIFAIGFALVDNAVAATIMWALPIYPLSSTAAFTFASLVSEEDERGKAMGLISGAQNAGSALGPIIGGLAAEFIFLRVQPISWINMIFNLLALIIAITMIKIGKELREKKGIHEVEVIPPTPPRGDIFPPTP